MDAKIQTTGLKKRQQIDSARRVVFVWIVISSVIVALALVTGQFLLRQAIFNQKIISEKSKAQSALKKDIKNAPLLKESITALLANSDLSAAKSQPTDNNLKVILDSLPVVEDQSALASSLQKIVIPKSGMSVSEMSLVPEEEAADSSDDTASDEVKTTSYDFEAVGSYDQTKAMLQDFRKTIRPLNITTLSITSAGAGALNVKVGGDAYFALSKTIEINKKTVKP